ncbi:MAG: hypothetical protein II662_07880 [Bacteroidales bacterium]|nr:hypothetical protein [Bacteroidales bacterium]
MKRISLFYVALVAVLFLACKQATPGDKMVELCNEYAEKLDKAQSSSQVDSLRALVDKGIEDILNTVPSDYEPTDEENVAVDEAMNKLQKALGVADEKFTAADEPDQQPAQEEQPQPDTEVATETEPLVEADTVKSIGDDLPKEQAKPEEDA